MMLSYLGTFEFKKEVLDFFEPFFNFSDHTCPFEENQVSFRKGTWCIGSESPAQVRNLYLFSSVIDAISYFHFFTDKLQYPDQIRIISVGVLPSFCQISQMKSAYRNAKIHFVFDADLLGKLFDCRLSLWIQNKDAKFLYIREREIISINFRNKNYQIPESQVSLFAFEKQLGLRSGIRTHKPPKNFNSFYELLLSSI